MGDWGRALWLTLWGMFLGILGAYLGIFDVCPCHG